MPFNRLTAAVGGNWIDTRERPGFEIDTRASRTEQGYNGILEVRALSKTFFGVRGEHRSIEFDEGENYQGPSSTELNRTVSNFGLTARSQLTPLTSISFVLRVPAGTIRLSRRFATPTRRGLDVGLNFDSLRARNRFGDVWHSGTSDLCPRMFRGYTGSTAPSTCRTRRSNRQD